MSLRKWACLPPVSYTHLDVYKRQVMKGAAAMAEFEPDWIVAIGGGSPIDAAKAMWIKYEYPDRCV